MSSPRRREEDSPATHRRREDIRRRRDGQNSPYRRSSGVLDEFNQLYINKDRAWNHDVEEQVAEQARRHEEALAFAAAEHERVRRGAERERERAELETERERKRKEEDDIRNLEAERNAKAERDAAERRRLKEELQRQQEEQDKRAAEEKEIAAARARLAEQKRKDDAETARRKTEQDEAERKAKAERDAAAKSTPAPASAPTPTQAAPPPTQPAPPTAGPSTNAQPAPTSALAPTPAPTTTTTSQPASTSIPQPAPSDPNTGNSLAEREALHNRYLQLHQRLKQMRKYVIDECKKNDPALKQRLGDMRRKITQTVGQLTINKTANQAPLREINRVLQDAQQLPQPQIDVAPFVVSTPIDGSPLMLSGPFLYLLNIFAKAVVNQLINEASVKPDVAEPIGVMAISIFAQPKFKVNGTISLMDVLLAKYHVACPILWGIFGDEKTAKGRSRIGWWKSDGQWVGEQQHSGRMAGLGVGYAALSLRDFSRSKNENPYPPSNYWKTLSYILNTPAGQVQATHFYVLKALIDGYIEKFVQYYGQAALVVLRKALVDFPAQAAKSPARDAVAVMQHAIQKDMGLYL